MMPCRSCAREYLSLTALCLLSRHSVLGAGRAGGGVPRTNQGERNASGSDAGHPRPGTPVLIPHLKQQTPWGGPI